MTGLLRLDTALLFFCNHTLADPFCDFLMPVLTRQGWLLVFPFFLIMVFPGTRSLGCGVASRFAAALLVVAVVYVAFRLGNWTEHTLKVLIARPRPCAALAGLRLLLPCPQSFSMPSGHAVSSFSVAVPLWRLTRSRVSRAWRSYPLVLAAIIVFTRLYLGVHYPSDVLVGTVLGAGIGMGLSLATLWGVGKMNLRWFENDAKAEEEIAAPKASSRGSR